MGYVEYSECLYVVSVKSTSIFSNLQIPTQEMKVMDFREIGVSISGMVAVPVFK